MREIKFRAYFDDLQDLPNVVYSGMVYDIGVTPTSILIYDDPSPKMKARSIIAEIGRDCDGLHVMQYAGLKDMNGKEIYEGDILEDIYGNKDEVIFKVSSFCRRGKDDDNAIMVWPFYQEYDLIKSSEVIGNIYESPELLEK